MARPVVTPRPPILRVIRTNSGSLTICRPVGPIDPTSSDDALAKNVSPGWSRWHLPWRLAAPRRRSFRYELEAPVEAVIEQESSAAVNVKVIPTMRVVHGRPDPTELLA